MRDILEKLVDDLCATRISVGELINKIKNYEDRMDKQIRKIEKVNMKEGKDLKKLEKMDKKRDKACEMGKKEMMKKKKK